MKSFAPLCALILSSATVAHAQERLESLCGPGHINEATSTSDVEENPDGFYIRSLQVQISHGDPRIIRATGKAIHFCTDPAATPDMPTNMALLTKDERRMRYLFVPTPCPSKGASS